MKGMDIIEKCTENESCSQCDAITQKACKQFRDKVKGDLGIRIEPWELNEVVRGEEF